MKKLSVYLTDKEKLWGWIYYPIQLLVLPFLISLINELAGSPLSRAWLNFVYFLINFLCIWLIFSRFLQKNGKIALASPFRVLYTALIGYIGSDILEFCIAHFIARVYPSFFNVNDAYIGAISQGNTVIMSIGSVFLVPIAEEVLYRGLIFGQIYKRNRILGYIVSILVFALVHVVGYIGSVNIAHLALCLLQYLPAGLALAWVYAASDSIWAPILLHMTINQIAMLS